MLTTTGLLMLTSRLSFVVEIHGGDGDDSDRGLWLGYLLFPRRQTATTRSTRPVTATTSSTRGSGDDNGWKGGDGNDTIQGGDGNDNSSGQGGADVIDGGRRRRQGVGRRPARLTASWPSAPGSLDQNHRLKALRLLDSQRPCLKPDKDTIQLLYFPIRGRRHPRRLGQPTWELRSTFRSRTSTKTVWVLRKSHVHD